MVNSSNLHNVEFTFRFMKKLFVLVLLEGLPATLPFLSSELSAGLTDACVQDCHLVGMIEIETFVFVNNNLSIKIRI